MAKQDEIRLIAYGIWKQEDCPIGKDSEHWFRAEAMWEQKQKDKTVAINTKTEPKIAAQKTSNLMPKRKR